ncbi:unnamed protein product [Lactuca saligna]|uniref:Uncharacterized protein n=1 Tax=Lactuca saligna TaxID=75948 RepID=A0AA36DYS2_LACSI|nr:unnamed protein product [Lactuca saligna]
MIKISVNGVEGQKLEVQSATFSAKIAETADEVPVLVSLLRSGPLGVKSQTTTVLGSLCKENELRVKVLLGGCIPLLLALLKSEEGQITAANTIYVVSEGDAKYHVGSKIFATEGVVLVLWEQLEKGSKVVDDLLTGALRNLCGTTEGFCSKQKTRKDIASCNGIPSLINAKIAPSKRFVQGEDALDLQENAMYDLSNISGGLCHVITSLGQSLDLFSSPG